MKETLDAFKFLFIGPAILVMLAVINYMTSPGDWWIQWPALGIGIAWFACLFRVAKAVIVAGGIAALAAYFSNKK